MTEVSNIKDIKKRGLFSLLMSHVEHKNALVITGMRQVGKTTLLRQVFDALGDKPKVWFDLDNPLDQKVFFYLKNLFPESLSGRKFVFTLDPLSFGEYLYFRGRIPFEDIAVKTKKKELNLRQRSIVDFKKKESFVVSKSFKDISGFVAGVFLH